MPVSTDRRQTEPCEQMLYAASPVTGGPSGSQMFLLFRRVVPEMSAVFPLFYFRLPSSGTDTVGERQTPGSYQAFVLIAMSASDSLPGEVSLGWRGEIMRASAGIWLGDRHLVRTEGKKGVAGSSDDEPPLAPSSARPGLCLRMLLHSPDPFLPFLFLLCSSTTFPLPPSKETVRKPQRHLMMLHPEDRGQRHGLAVLALPLLRYFLGG